MTAACDAEVTPEITRQASTNSSAARLQQYERMNIHRKVPFTTIAVLMTSFNRRDQTLACLAALSAQRDIEGITVTVFPVDDNSTDSTTEAVRARFPEVNLLHGDGSLFWNGGMRLAFAMAMQRGFDAYFFLNDDTVLYEDAVRRLIDCAVSDKVSGIRRSL